MPRRRTGSFASDASSAAFAGDYDDLTVPRPRRRCQHSSGVAHNPHLEHVIVAEDDDVELLVEEVDPDFERDGADDEELGGSYRGRRRRERTERATGKPNVEHRPTRRQLRGAAPDGLLIEDILQRINFDAGLSSEDFTALVDPVDHTDPSRPPTPRGAKWCRSFCWTGRCRFGDQSCWYSHGGPRLVLWGVGPLRCAPGSHKTALAQMKAVQLSEIGEQATEGAHASSTICFLQYKGLVVWGRDLGTSGSDLWSRFVRCGKTSRDEPGPIGPIAGFVPLHTAPGLGGDCEWKNLPGDLWARVLRGLDVSELIDCALAIGPEAADWASVAAEFWPELNGAASSGGRAEAVGFVRHFAGLLEASRLVAQCLRWPHKAAFVLAADFSPSPQHSPPTSPVLKPSGQPTPRPAPRGWLRPAVQRWMISCAEPSTIRTDAEVTSLRLGASLVACLCADGEICVFRRADCRRVAKLRVRGASCFDFRDETLVVGTGCPAKLLAFDLSEASSKPSHQSTLDQRASVLNLEFLDKDTCFCVVGGGASAEVLVVDTKEDFVVARRVQVKLAVPVQLGFVVLHQGRVSIWGLTRDDVRCTAELRLPAPTAPPPPASGSASSSESLVAAQVCGRYVAVHDASVSANAVLVHDMQQPAAADPFGLTAQLPSGWELRGLQIEGSVLLAVGVLGGQFLLEDTGGDHFRLPPSMSRLCAWHLPSMTTLVRDWPLYQMSALARTAAGTRGPLAFAGLQPARGKDRQGGYMLVLPRRAGDPGGLDNSSAMGQRQAPLKRTVKGSDIRARGMHYGARLGR